MQFHLSKRALLSSMIAVLMPLSAHAENPDLESRIQQLEKMIQNMQQQRAEQDKQVEILTKELAGIENQVSQSKITKTEEKGSSKGSPVYGNFKDGLVFEDGSGNWKLQLNGRIQTDYRAFSPDDWKMIHLVFAVLDSVARFLS